MPRGAPRSLLPPVTAATTSGDARRAATLASLAAAFAAVPAPRREAIVTYPLPGCRSLSPPAPGPSKSSASNGSGGRRERGSTAGALRHHQPAIMKIDLSRSPPSDSVHAEIAARSTGREPTYRLSHWLSSRRTHEVGVEEVPMRHLSSDITEPSRYAAVGGPNQVVSASGSPRCVRSPTQATCPSGRINTAEGAGTSPSTGSSHMPACVASTN